jgi:hypothetical protein
VRTVEKMQEYLHRRKFLWQLLCDDKIKAMKKIITISILLLLIVGIVLTCIYWDIYAIYLLVFVLPVGTLIASHVCFEDWGK